MISPLTFRWLSLEIATSIIPGWSVPSSSRELNASFIDKHEPQDRVEFIQPGVAQVSIIAYPIAFIHEADLSISFTAHGRKHPRPPSAPVLSIFATSHSHVRLYPAHNCILLPSRLLLLAIQLQYRERASSDPIYVFHRVCVFDIWREVQNCYQEGQR